MPTCFDDEDDNDPEAREKRITDALRESFQQSLDPQFKTEYDGDRADAIKERAAFRLVNLSPWDKILGPRSRAAIAEMDIPSKETCPYLRQAEGAEFLYYCQIVADQLVLGGDRRDGKPTRFTGRKATKQSAEFHAQRVVGDLTTYCVGSSFPHCEIYIAEQAKDLKRRK